MGSYRNQRTCRVVLAASTIASMMALAGCAASHGDDKPTASVSAAAGPGSPVEASADPSTSPAGEGDEGTKSGSGSIGASCDDVIATEEPSRFQAAGWAGQARDQEWPIGGVPVDDGILCQWMEDHTVATDNFTWLGWAGRLRQSRSRSRSRSRRR